jgi:HTH-type transcriptional regulator/antitoxin HipB
MRSQRSPAPAAFSQAAQQLGGLLRARRKTLRIKQAELAALAGVGLAFLYELEHGKASVRLDKLFAVLQVLGLELHVQQGHQLVSAATPASRSDST